ncbi:MAG: hypothetical protein JOZ69_15230 [Myxococcales bacterium]|nr:hypothetical protein [Myxococcales bacterium]
MRPGRPHLGAAVAAGVSAIAAACSASRPPANGGDPGGGGAADSGNSADSGGRAESSDAADAPDAADPADAGKPADAGALDAHLEAALSEGAASLDAPADGVTARGPRCSPDHAWTGFGRIAAVSPDFGRFGGVSADELSIAWSSAGVAYVADRAVRSEVFGAPVALPAAQPIAPGDRIALSPGGTTVVAAKAAGSAFVVFARASRSDAWAAGASLAYAAVNGMAGVEGGGRFSEPVLGADGRSLYFRFQALGAGPDAQAGAAALFESRWDDQAHVWSAGVALPGPELAGLAGAPARATGASTDGRTLFFFDPGSGAERAAWRETPSSAFTVFRVLPGLSEAAPNDRCDTLYFAASDDAGAGIFLAQ